MSHKNGDKSMGMSRWTDNLQPPYQYEAVRSDVRVQGSTHEA